MRINRYIEEIQKMNVEGISYKTENLINESIKKVNDLLTSVIDDDREKIKKYVGEIVFDLVSKNKLTEEERLGENSAIIVMIDILIIGIKEKV